MRYLFTLLFTLLFVTEVQAAQIYRHLLPFSSTLNSGDTLVVDYDFSGKTGIFCSANNKIQIHFSYKGNEKVAILPRVLQNTMPTKKYQELADISGQFTLTAPKSPNTQFYTVKCGYVGE